MNRYNLDDDDPNNLLYTKDTQHLFGHSYENMNEENPFLTYEHNYLSSQQQYDSSSYQNDTSPSPSSGLGQEYMYSQAGLDDIYNSNGFNGSQFFDNQVYQMDNKMNDEMYVNMDSMGIQQQAILLSDPNFLRQQHLLHNQHNKAQKIMDEEHPVRSNLSAMFNNNTHNQHTHNNAPVKVEPINLVSSPHQHRKDISRPRSLVDKNSKPIPISTPTTQPPTSASSSVPTEIDHQRRFNELQARFRVNYSKKPQKHTHPSGAAVSFGMTGTSMPTSFGEQTGFNEMSSSYTEDITTSTSLNHNTRKSSSEVLNSSNKPLLRVNRDSKVKTPTNPNPNITNNHQKTVSNAGNAVNIPTNPSTSTGHLQAASLPSRTIPIQIQRVHRANASQHFDAEQRQKRLDDQLVKVDFNDITVSELKEMLRQRGKPATGKKAILLQRLQEELEMIKQARMNGKSFNRYSHPLIQNSRSSPIPPQIDASPMMDHAVSLPDSTFLSRSPGSSLLSLNRSIADMHIGSPPMTSQQSRRFAPYASSPRISTTNAPINQQHIYSSSVPTHSLDMMMHNTNCNDIDMNNSRSSNFNFNKKSYAPFTSSALATPDHDKVFNPFDEMKYTNPSVGFNSLPNDMEWTDPMSEQMFQQGLDVEIPEEDFLQLLASQDIYANNQFMNSIDKTSSMKYQTTHGGPDLSSVMFEDDNTMSDYSGKSSRDYLKNK